MPMLNSVIFSFCSIVVAAEGKICDVQCSTQGCWGPGPRQCLSCKNYHLDNMCLESCNDSLGIYEVPGEKTCKRCHEECDFKCSAEVRMRPYFFSDVLIAQVAQPMLFRLVGQRRKSGQQNINTD